MHVFLVHHGPAKPKDEDPKRPLSDSGREDVKRMASFLARSGVVAGRVLHSGKLRALELSDESALLRDARARTHITIGAKQRIARSKG